MALTTKFVTTLVGTLTDALDLSTATDPLSYTKRTTLTSGTGANQADMMWHDTRTLSASADEDLDLAGVLVNGLGDTQTFARVKGLLVAAASGNTNNCNVTSYGSAGVPGLFLALGDGVVVRPGGLFLWTSPDATGAVVTAATGDLLNVANSSGSTSVTYDVVIIGASA
jgi:hypothetical protein